ncbi:MAG: hypothetical protein JWR84_1628 [Caulobacter sp.]|nr:hypothetical protein [Caulobacter sp.]
MRNTQLARAFRRGASKAERRFWGIVRAGRLAGYKFRRQVPIDRYVVDFICMDARVVVELDGVSHQDREQKDAERTAVLERLGYLVIRFANNDVIENADGVAVSLLETLALARPRQSRSVCKPSPSHAFGAGPSLSLAGEGS